MWKKFKIKNSNLKFYFFFVGKMRKGSLNHFAKSCITKLGSFRLGSSLDLYPSSALAPRNMLSRWYSTSILPLPFRVSSKERSHLPSCLSTILACFLPSSSWFILPSHASNLNLQPPDPKVLGIVYIYI